MGSFWPLRGMQTDSRLRDEPTVPPSETSRSFPNLLSYPINGAVTRRRFTYPFVLTRDCLEFEMLTVSPSTDGCFQIFFVQTMRYAKGPLSGSWVGFRRQSEIEQAFFFLRAVSVAME